MERNYEMLKRQTTQRRIACETDLQRDVMWYFAYPWTIKNNFIKIVYNFRFYVVSEKKTHRWKHVKSKKEKVEKIQAINASVHACFVITFSEVKKW